eukprot:scpid69297/ scgid23032/ 
MELFPKFSKGRAAASPAGLEKVVHFLREIGPAGWPLLNLLVLKKKITSMSQLVPDAQLAPAEKEVDFPAQFFVNDIQDPHWVACIAHERDDVVHVTLGFAPLGSQPRVAECLDALEAAAALNWNLELLFRIVLPSTRCQSTGEEILKHGSKTVSRTFKQHLSRLYLIYGKREAFVDNGVSSIVTGTPCHSCDGDDISYVLPPSGLVVDTLGGADAAIIDGHLTFGRLFKHSLPYITGIIAEAPDLTCGIYATEGDTGDVRLLKNDDESEHVETQCSEPEHAGNAERRELVAWAVVTTYGTIGLLHTLEKYRRRGCALAVIRRLEAAMRRNSLHVFSCISAGNEASEECFEKAGFKRVSDLDLLWLKLVPE